MLSTTVSMKINISEEPNDFETAWDIPCWCDAILKELGYLGYRNILEIIHQPEGVKLSVLDGFSKKK